MFSTKRFYGIVFVYHSNNTTCSTLKCPFTKLHDSFYKYQKLGCIIDYENKHSEYVYINIIFRVKSPELSEKCNVQTNLEVDI